MTPLTIIGIVAGVLAFVFAGAVVVWAVSLARKGMHSEPAMNCAVVDKMTLQQMLLKLNQPGHPFQVRTSNEADLVIEWSVVDAKWIEVLGRAWERMNYYAWIVIDDNARTVKYHERIHQASVVAGGGSGLTGKSYSARGFESWAKRRGYRWGIRDDFSVGEIYNFQFTPNDLKEIIRQIVNDHGWVFELTLAKPRLSRAT